MVFEKGHKPLNLRPNSGSFKKGNASWSKGLTKETDERIRMVAESKTRKEKISNSMKELYKEGIRKPLKYWSGKKRPEQSEK